jgi:oligogalacturonide transporter
MLAFSVGDIFGGGSFNIINFLYPGFLAFAVGLSAQTAGLVMLVARIFDAVIDPVIGFFSDKLRVRFGTRRSSVIIAAPFLVLSMFLMFYPYDNPNETVRFWAVLLSYMFFALSQSVVMISYFSLSTEITDDYTERARMTSLRLGFSIFSSIVCVAVPGMIVSAFDGNKGYIAMSLIFGVIFMFCVGITGFFAKEDVPAPTKSEPFAISDFIRPFKVKPFRQYLYIFLCCQMTMAVMSALFFFYVDFYFCRDLTAGGEGNVVGLIGAALMFGMQIVALPIYLAMIKKTSKTAVYILGSVIWIVGALFLYIVPANSSPVLIYILAAVLGFGISGPGLIPHAIFGDVVDVGNLQLGVHTAGAFGGIANFINQISQAVGVGFVMMILGIAGFVEQDISVAEPVTSQPVSAQTAIILIMMLAPLVFMSFGIFVCTRYKLNKEKHAQVLAAIENGDEEKKAEILKSL